MLGNEFIDPFAQPQDTGNPHGDMVQLYGQDGVNPYLFPLLIEVIGNLGWFRSGCRGGAQRVFNSDFMDGYPSLSAIVADNVLVSRMSGKGVIIDSHDNGPPGTGGAWAMVERNVLIANPRHNAPIQNEPFKNPNSTGAANLASNQVSITVGSDPLLGTPAPQNFVFNNLCEVVLPEENMLKGGNLVTNAAGIAPDAYAAFMDPRDGLSWDAAWTIASGDEIVRQVKAMKPAYQYACPVPADVTTAAAFRARWSDPAQRPYAALPSRFGWKKLTGLSKGALTQSGWTFVHAGKEARPLSGLGGEYRTADDRLGTNASGWAALPSPAAGVTIAHGRFLQLRRATAATQVTEAAVEVTIGGTTVNWVTVTKSDVAYPRVLFTGGEPDLVRAPQGALGPDGRLGTLALIDFKKAARPATTQTLFSSATGTARVQMQLLPTGKLRLNLYQGGSAIIRLETTVDVCDGQLHDILFSWDAAKDTNIEGGDVYVDGVNRLNTAGIWAAGVINYGYTTATYGFGYNSAGGADFEVGAFYLNVAERAAVHDADVRARFTTAFVGTNGAGPTGQPPAVFLVGNAAQWNDAAGLNRGAGPRFTRTAAAALTDAGSGVAWA